MKHVVSIAFTSSAANFENIVDFFGQRIRISHFGADFNIENLKSLIQLHDGKADVIALTGLHPSIKIKNRFFVHKESEKIKQLVKISPLVDGYRLRNTYIPWALRQCAREDPRLFHKQRIGFYSGLLQKNIAIVLSDYTERLLFADPFFHFGLPKVIHGLENLDSYGLSFRSILSRIHLDQRTHILETDNLIVRKGLKEFLDCNIFVSTASLLERFSLEHLKNKVVLVDGLPPHMVGHLKDAGVKDIIHFKPDVEVLKQEPRITYPILEGLFQCYKNDSSPITEDEVLQWIINLQLKPRVNKLNQLPYTPPSRFAFIIHPLSLRDVFRYPVLKPLQFLEKNLEYPLEKACDLLPAMKYGQITGIKSQATGAETEGIIYALFSTPRMLKDADPESVYEKLVACAKEASREGADIIGLGAYTKIVGDAGVTVSQRSPIPVTTGNSLSAAATLWAARIACEKMGFLPKFKFGQTVHGTAMIIGASGSIGHVSAKLLSMVMQKLILVAPRPDKLLEIKGDIESGHCVSEIHIAVNPDLYAHECDLIVTSTSSIDEKVIDIMKVKPGCVICDVSRPLAISEEEALKRPDVLCIESGEVELPGNVKLNCDIGLQESVVYACLAETALLALEGRMESFTISRNINFEKVREIYDLAKKHGARLAKIRSHAGEVTDQEIALCREHALRALGKI